MGEKLFDEVRQLLGEIDKEHATPLSEAITPVGARNLKELSERVIKSWNRAYGEFADSRNAAYDVAATFNLSTRVSLGPKEVKNITRDTEDSLAASISWVADRFRHDYQNAVVKRGGDLRALAERLSEVAHGAKDLGDRDLHEAAVKFLKEFL